MKELVINIIKALLGGVLMFFAAIALCHLPDEILFLILIFSFGFFVGWLK